MKALLQATFTLLVLGGAAITLPCAAGAQGQGVVVLRANRNVLLANGNDAAELIADVRDPGGRQIDRPILIQFQTNRGTLSATSAQTFGGRATTRLTSVVTGVAQVSAFAPGIGWSAPVEIVFTDDPEATFQGNAYITVTGASYLAYSATDRVIEANGRDGGARITFRNIEITADRMQLRCDDNIVRAHHNVLLKRAGKTFRAIKLYYSLQSGQGYALAELEGRLQNVYVSGETLRVVPSPTPIPSSYMMLPELQVKLVIVARSITYFPGDRLQFRRPRFFQDQVQILSLPFYELPYNSEELFSDQFISIGTNGFGLELPVYYALSPHKRGIVYLRHQQSLGRGYFAFNPGWALDVIEDYSRQGNQRYEGAYGFVGLTRGDWSFRWTHNHEFNIGSQGTFYLDFPQHNGVFTTSNFNQQSRKVRWGANFSYGRTFSSMQDTSTRGDVYWETQPRHLLGSNHFLQTIGTSFASTRVSSNNNDVGLISETTQTVTWRAFSRPIALDTRTTLATSLSVGHLWSSNRRNGLTTLANLSLDHTIPGGGTLSLTYDFVRQPAGQFISTGTHRLGIMYSLVKERRFEVSLFGSAFLDAPDASFFADATYLIDRNWRFIASAALQTFEGQSFRDIQFTLGRRIGARELQLTYSTFFKRISLDLTATRF